MLDASAPGATTDQEPTSPAPGVKAVDGKPLASSVEAILLTIDRPVSAARLAEALGLGQPEPEAVPVETSEGPDSEEPRSDRGMRKKRQRRAAPTDSGEPLVRRCIDELNETYAATGRSFRISEVAGGFRVMTLPEFAPAVAAFHRARQSGRLSRAAIETLAIVAYRQPITRAHLEAVRGVACGEVLRSLMERRLVTIKGRAEELGRPILYGTTKEFLDAFGLGSLKDLPTAAELQPGP